MTRSVGTSWFLPLTSLREAALGLSLLRLLAVVLAMLLGVEETAKEAVVLARGLGAVLLAIGVTCRMARSSSLMRDWS